MEFVKLHKPIFWPHKHIATKVEISHWDQLVAFTGNYSSNKATRLYILLAVQGVLFIPQLLLMILYYQVSFATMAVIVIAFIANIITCMNRPGTRAQISVVAIGVIDLLTMIIFLI